MIRNKPKAEPRRVQAPARIMLMPKLKASSSQDVHLYEDIRTAAQMLYTKEAQIRSARTVEQQFMLYREQMGLIRDIDASCRVKLVRIKEIANSVRRKCDSDLKRLRSMSKKAKPEEKEGIERQIAYTERMKKIAEELKRHVRTELINTIRGNRTVLWHLN